MLVLSRHRDESIIIGDDVIITVVDIRGDKCRLGFEAPAEITIHRREIYDHIQRVGTDLRYARPPALPNVDTTLERVTRERDAARAEAGRLAAALAGAGVPDWVVEAMRAEGRGQS